MDEQNLMIYEELYQLGYIEDEITEEEVESEEWDIPINTEYIKDKKMDYEVLGLITLFSNYNSKENHRYLYEKGYNSLYSNLDKMEEISNNKKRNIKRGIKKLTECDNEVVAICEDKEGRMYYKISPYACEDDKKGCFITINSKMLEYLIDVGNSNVIKTYCAIKILLWNNDKKCYIKRPLTRDFLLRYIGLSINGKNLTTMSNILKNLVNNGYIKRKRVIKQDKVNGEIITKDTYEYELVSVYEWEDFDKNSK